MTEERSPEELLQIARARAQRANSSRAILWTTLVAMLTASVTLGWALTSTIKEKVVSSEASDLARQNDARILQLQVQVARLQEQQSSQLRPAQVQPPLAVLDQRLKDVEQRQQQLDHIIMSDPNKALEMPLMRRDLDALDKRDAEAIDSIRRSVEQVYDLSKWLLGALAVGVLSLAITTFFRRRTE